MFKNAYLLTYYLNIYIIGQDANLSKVGEVATPLSTLTLWVHQRTQMTLPSNSKAIGHDQMMLKSDHFKSESSPRHGRKISYR